MDLHFYSSKNRNIVNMEEIRDHYGVMIVLNMYSDFEDLTEFTALEESRGIQIQII